MRDGFVKAAAAAPHLKVADPAFNCTEMISLIEKAYEEGVSIIVFPELSISGYTCGDLFFQQALQRACDEGLGRIAEASKGLDILIFAGYPFQHRGKLYNTAAAIWNGRVLALIPKKNIPSYGEFYETRWFAPSPDENEWIDTEHGRVLFGRKTILRFRYPSELAVAAEICEDLWVADSPSIHLASAGATVIANLSASDEIIGKEEYRKSLVSMQSARLSSAYIYADATIGESTTDMVFTGNSMIAENGSMLSYASMLDGGYITADIDVARLSSERRRMNTFTSSASGYEEILIDNKERDIVLSRCYDRHPFVPDDEGERDSRCQKILDLQALGLRKRLEASHARKAVVGLSGGLDSTLALIVAVRAFRMLGKPLEDIIAVTMPCFGTTARTKGNAENLAESFGVTLMTVDIKAAVTQHFADIGQDPEELSTTYENSQARERTQVLMDIANKEGGIVIGTGDLSELALGWATYNGDHMSMYGVNASVPKTLVRYLVRYESEIADEKTSAVLRDILATPVSPELLPAKDGTISQITEDIVGPYELHDFFLYYMVRFGFSPRKIFRIASIAFNGVYDGSTIKKWLITFVRRFFSQQFKRSCLPDGPKVGSVTLSPRSDWRMPSDAEASLWIEEAESI